MTEQLEILPITPDNFPYWYRADVIRVIDGDSVVVDIDLGMNVFHKNRHIRLAGIDAWETRMRPPRISDVEWDEHRSKGRAATEFVRSILVPGLKVVINTEKDKGGKYGRLLARIYSPRPDGTWFDLIAALKIRGYEKKK